MLNVTEECGNQQVASLTNLTEWATGERKVRIVAKVPQRIQCKDLESDARVRTHKNNKKM